MATVDQRQRQERYYDLRDPIKSAQLRSHYMFPLWIAFNLGLAAWALYIFIYYDGSCNMRMHNVFLGVGVVFALDALFIGCNYFYLTRVYTHALHTIDASEDDMVVGEFLVPPTTPAADPMDLRATQVMDSICSFCLSAAYMACANLAGLVAVITGIIWVYTSAACDGKTLQMVGRIYFIVVTCLVLLRILWCRFYFPFLSIVLHIFRFEHIRWNRAPRSDDDRQ